MVAPFAGAWIEMKKWLHGKLMLQSLPSRERGLKSPIENDNSGKLSSLPSRERGLKFTHRLLPLLLNQSLPSRERGLKLINVLQFDYVFAVAPFAGAWIEI